MSFERDASPLRQQLSARAEQLRKEYLRRGFSRDDYQRLVDRAEAVVRTAAGLKIDDADLQPIRDCRSVLVSVVKLLTDPKSETIPPTNDEVYAAALTIARLGRLFEQFDSAPPAWKNQLALLVRALGSTETDAGRLLVMLEFAGLCRSVGISIRPAPEARAELELEEWQLAASSAVAESRGALSKAAQQACAGLVAMKRPGLIVLDAGSAMPDAPSLRRVGNDQTAALEMQRHVDQFIIDQHETLVEAVDTQYAFAAVVGAVLHTVNVSTGLVNFAACYRTVNLCELDDPRAPRLRRLMDRLSAFAMT
ncbi:MAG: hypothetical protein D6695_03485 [Planctomycetota bacterium]|nr:MAG: hypothetical protein D6695_03485 [Planctomycetota bacterium]